MLTYRIRDTIDAEERLEDAAMFKALYDATGGRIEAIREGEGNFGAIAGPYQVELRYYDDPAFLAHCGRRFDAMPFEKVAAAVAELHADGLDAFLKSALQKFFIAKVHRGETVREVVGDMSYSFFDSPVPMMVQELVDFTFEHRFFCIDRKIVAWSPAAYHLTPIDYPMPRGVAFRKQADTSPAMVHPEVQFAMEALARRVAADMRTPTATIDIGLIDDMPAVVELNPFRIGQVGLFAADVRAIARAALSALP